ncbi:MAG: peptidase [Azoarcus sp.]|nr:MAG: peptidase [Azoarcus sp.]
MYVPRSRLFDLRPRLARRLGLIAFAGLSAVGVLMVLAFCAVVFALMHSWQTLNEGEPLATVASSLAAVCAAYLCARLTTPEPEGILLPPDAAPEFYCLMDDIGSHLGADPIDRVWITRDPNATVLQRARWGCVGRIESHLLLGLPLVHSVSRSQLAAVMAHEFAHLALQRKGLGKLGAHVRAWWFRVLDAMCESIPLVETLADRVLRRFYRDMLRLSRIEEFEADAIAAKLVGAGLLGETLVEVTLKERFLRQDYWPKVMAQSESRARPSIRPYREMGLGVETGFLRPASVRAVTAVLLEDEEDVSLPFHPSLHQRLSALRVPLRAAQVDRPSAARHYFAPLLPSLAWVFDHAWWQDVRSGWRSQYARARRSSRD